MSKENGTPQGSRLLLEELGLSNEWVEVSECYRVIIQKDSEGNYLDVTMPTGVKAYIDQLETEVPGSRQSVEKLFALIEEMTAAVDYINSTNGNPDSKHLQKNYPDFLRCAAYSCQKVFDALKIPKKAQDVLAVYWTYLGQPMDTMAFLHYGMGIHQYISRSPYIPVLTSHCTSVDLLQKYQELGGEVWFNTAAVKILVKDGKVTGVETTNGIVETKVVVGNLNPHMVFGQMIEEKEVPVREKMLASKRDFGFRFFNIYMGMNQTPEQFGIKDYSVFLYDSANLREIYDQMGKIETNDYAIFNCYNIANPTCSPEGTSICTITAMFSGDAWKDVKIEDYHKVKEEYALRLIKLVEERLGIHLMEAIEEIEIATPVTFARYLGTPQGTAYGYQTNLWDSMFARLMSMEQDRTIEGLYLAGAAGSRAHGNNIGYMVGDTMGKLAVKALS